MLLLVSNAYASINFDAGYVTKDSNEFLYTSLTYQKNEYSIGTYYSYGDVEEYRTSYLNQPVNSKVYSAIQHKYVGVSLGYSLFRFNKNNLHVDWKLATGYEWQLNKQLDQYYISNMERHKEYTNNYNEYIIGMSTIEIKYDVMYLKALLDSQQRMGILFGVSF